MSVTIFEPNVPNPYYIPTDIPVVLRTACSAGVNRSATVRECVKNNIHPDSIIYPQYGAEYADFDNNKIIIHNIENDGFYNLFGENKVPNIQMNIAKEIYSESYNPTLTHTILEKDRTAYKNMLIQKFWITNLQIKNIFIIINEDQRVIDLTIKRLNESNEHVDLIILRIPDVIYYTHNNIKRQSKEAYESFIRLINYFIKYN